MKDPFVIQEKNIKKGRMKGYSNRKLEGEIWPIKKGSGESLGKSISEKRLKSFFVFIFLCFLILFGRVFWLQIVRGEYYRNLAEGNRIRTITVKAPRGVIYDRNGQLLVKNIPKFDLYFVPADLIRDERELDELAKRVSEILKSNTDLHRFNTDSHRSRIKELFENSSPYSYQPQLIQENLSYETALLLEVKTSKLPGIVLETNSRREYLGSQELSHLLGYTGKISPKELKEKQGYLFNDYIGKAGLEFQYENILKGVDGKKQIEVDSLGKEKRVIKLWSSQAGEDLILSINLDLQKKLSRALQNGLKRAGSKKGAAIVLDPRNGEILAMVSLPNFDNNKFSLGMNDEEYEKLINDPNQPLFFRAISGQYPSGSIIKPLIAAAALEEEVITSQTVINSKGGIKIDKWFFPDWKVGGHGPTRVVKAIAESVNTFFYYIGGGYENFQGLGLERINRYLQFFGLNKILGIDLSNEKPGFLPSREWKEKEKGERWYIGDTYHLSIGQGDILVTPLQAASWTAAIANGGILYQPKIRNTKKYESTKYEKLSYPVSPEALVSGPKIIRKNFISPQNLEIVKQGMRQTVLSGSGRALSDLPIKVAGKTGTAQAGANKNPHAWFTCFAPYDNPEIVITVLIENGGEGSITALSVAREILQTL